MDALKRKRATLKQKLTIFRRFLEPLKLSFTNKETIPVNKIKELEERNTNSTNLLEEFEEIQTQIENLNNDLEPDLESRLEFESNYYEIRGYAHELIDFLKPANEELTSASPKINEVKDNASSVISNPNSPNQNFVKLPTISLPKFDGNGENWLEFRDLFESLIHLNNSITPIQKYHYLRSSVHGAPSLTIKSIEFSSDNYKLAWETLCKRYNNKRMLVNNHIKQIVSFEHMAKESSQKLRYLHDNLYKHINALKSLDKEETLFESIFIYLSSHALDQRTLRDWETHRTNSDELPTLDEFCNFIQSKADLLETLEYKQSVPYIKDKPRQTKVHIAKNQNYVATCILCKGEHLLQSCETFLKIPLKDRDTKVRELKACINCLRKGHFGPSCTSKYTCKYCKAKHHSLLHFEEPAENNPQLPLQNNVTAAHVTNSCKVLLPTVSVGICDKNGIIQKCRALLDSGAQSCFITTNLSRKLGVQTHPINIKVTGIGNASSTISERTEIEVLSLNSTFKRNISFLVIDKITSSMPGFYLQSNELDIPAHVKLADPEFDQTSPIDLLLGAPVFWELLCIGQIRLGNNRPILQKTRFGWIVSGAFNSSNYNAVHCNFVQIPEVNDHLERFWEIDQFPSTKSLTAEEIDCETHFINNVKRSPEGQFIVAIPFKVSPENLGESKTVAERQFLKLEKRFCENKKLSTLYKAFMTEYEQLGHMSLVNENSNKVAYYLPHHGVLREQSISTKLRVVFNGSSLTDNGESLNSIQMIGPSIQQDLVSILLRFRKHTFAISADIEKMYRQVLVDPSQRSLQRILWRSNANDPINTYELNTVTYGTASAPFLAIRSLYQLGIEAESINSELARIIKQDFYVDDVLTGADSVEDATYIINNLCNILSSGGFTLKKWVSNNPQILEGLAPADIHPNVLDLGVHEYTKTLGLIWSHQSDSLTFFIQEPTQTKITKRSLLSEIAQIFDPLGLLSPCTIIAKCIIQQLWLEKLSWDQDVPKEIQKKWTTFRENLICLNNLNVPRHILTSNCTSIQMHGFCDASLTGYGACIYMRSENKYGEVSVNLLYSKAKVAPLKPTTIPRLELCGAYVLAKAMEQSSNALNLGICPRFYWSDSTIVLSWLKINPTLLKPFVCNRVVEIQALTKDCIWNHVSGKCNPADLLSRGTSADQLINSSLWWHGPDWLSQSQVTWPKTSFVPTELPELKSSLHNLVVSIEVISFNKYSKYSFLVRVTAYCLRFIQNCRYSANRITGPLTSCEIRNASIQLVKIAQHESFPEELKLLQKNKPIKTCGHILRLNPFLDNNGIIRVGGRLQNSHYSFDKKHPMLLSGKHRFSHLLLSSEHVRLLHAGPQLLLSTIRERYWITSGRSLANKICRQCITCFRFSPKTLNPLMGNLPSLRVTPSFPFLTTGIDYGGPLLIKDRKGRGSKTSKSYICLFICFVTRSVHLELVTSLTSESFILALRRFVARRGKPLNIYCDNGTNFIGAKRELHELGKFLKQNHDHLTELAAVDEINWTFIPASSPHFGGLWEAGIKSSKHHLKRVVGNSILTFEELSTLLTQVEAILNSRPLSPLSSDPNDLNPLTPSHFLIGRASDSVADPSVLYTPESRLSVFQKIQQLQQQFWARWSKEYVCELQTRMKWLRNQDSLVENQIVLIKDDNLPSLNWKLGRIVTVYPGKDGISRVASIRTAKGTIKRSFSKICPLPSEETV